MDRLITLEVNGVPRRCAVDDRTLLVDLLRDQLGLTAAKVGCGHGACGSCTVLLDGRAVRACLLFAVQADGRAVRTAEDLAVDGELHPLQQAFADCHALQCGFCTPGLLMTVLPRVERGPLDRDEAREAIAGNLCRCTGYEPIVDAVVAASQRLASSSEESA